MKKKPLLKSIANTAYNTGFGAKKHFATFDIVEKIPGWIGFITMAIGILQIAYPTFSYNKIVSIALIIIGISTLHILSYFNCKNDYDEKGKKLTDIFNELRDLYFSVEQSGKQEFTEELEKLKLLEKSFYEISESKQIFLSDWYAHYKFFFQMQVDWIVKELNLTFLKDKIPKSFAFWIMVIVISGISIFIKLRFF